MTGYQPSPPSGKTRSLGTGLLRGLRRKCPNCGEARAFAGYLKLTETCRKCDHELGSYRCDDAPPYFTIFIVGHIVIPGLLLLEKLFAPAMWIQLGIWLPATIILSLCLLPYVKGAVLGVQWAMHIKG